MCMSTSLNAHTESESLHCKGVEVCHSQYLHADIFERFAALEKSGAKAEEGAGAERRAGGAPAGREGQPGQDNEDGEFPAVLSNRDAAEKSRRARHVTPLPGQTPIRLLAMPWSISCQPASFGDIRWGLAGPLGCQDHDLCRA